MDVLYAPLEKNVHVKRFLGALVRGLSLIFHGGNMFGKVISGIERISGYIFRGNGLLHHHKIAALKQGVSVLKQHAGRIRIGDLFKICSFKNLHIGRVSLLDKLNKKFHDVKHSILHDFNSPGI